MELAEIATLLDQACVHRSPVAQFSGQQSFNLEQAYQIQQESMALRYDRGEQLVGYKLGFTSKAKMEQMGVHELIWGHLTNLMDRTVAGDLDLNSFIHPRAEPEIAFRIGQAINKPLDWKQARARVSAVSVALEIIDSRYRNFSFTLEDVVADNCSSAAFALGPWVDAEIGIEDLNIELQVDGETVHQGNSKAIMGNPWESLAELSRLTAAYDISIPEGFVVLAGAATPAVHIKEAHSVSANAEALGQVELKIHHNQS